MARARTWKLQLNLDDFNSAWASLANSPEERASFIEGMWRGMNAGRIGPAEDFAFQEGHAFGLSMREEAEEYRKQSAEAGAQGGYQKHKTKKSRVPSRVPSSVGKPSLVGTVKPILNPQTDNPLNQESEQPNNQPPTGAPSDGPEDEVQKILQEWNSMAQRVGIHQSRGVGPILKTLRQKVKQPGWVDLFLGALPFIEGSPFYHGKNDRGWKAHLEWLLRPGKVEELTGREPEKPKNGTTPEHRRNADEALLAQLKEMGMA